MHYFEGLSFFMTLGLVLIVAFILNVFQKSTYYLSLLFSLVMVYFVFIKTPDQLIALLGFVLVGYILMQLTVNCGENFACVSCEWIWFFRNFLYDLQISPNHS